ncbi:MAG: demethoxyubiquinone hydroxylase family protein [Alphaproteobacteria bacterium]|nr:demethoxyubiquinone hydroxylase family protein [Alphaproteobacteria bacterium]OJV45150.1 MAG: hypothetical protein BGO28_03970 [Alphaproteobacteria bacterium 43-37]
MHKKERNQKRNTHAMIRVDHAGESGAVQIYKGQLAVLGCSPLGDTLREMLAHEEDHLRKFDDLIRQRRVRPTFFSPLWHVGAYAVGALTAFMGEKVALACTVAVEEVIDEHYEEQKNALMQDNQDNQTAGELLQTIVHCQAEEVLHKNMALSLGAEQAVGYRALTTVIKGVSKTAIWLSKRF